VDHAILASLITGVLAVFASCIPIFFSRLNKSNRSSHTSSDILGLGDYCRQRTLELNKTKELKVIWEQFLAKDSKRSLELCLRKIEVYISKYPDISEGHQLKSLILEALEAKRNRRFIGPPPRHPILIPHLRFHTTAPILVGVCC
jgi:hypothetical protein